MQQSVPAIDKRVVFACWNSELNLLNSATIKIGSISVRCHFFTALEIENDFDPREVVNIEDHYRLVDYFVNISRVLNKEAVITAENQPALIYMSVNNEVVIIK
jgi:hypothetical protein